MDSPNRVESPLSLYRILAVGALSFSALVLYLASTTLTFGSRAYAQDEGTLPVASLVSVSPSSVREGSRLRVVVRLTPMSGSEEKPIRGGVKVFDSWNGPRVDELVAWAFRGGTETREVTSLVCYDGETTANRNIRIVLHPGWEDHRIGTPTEMTISVLEGPSDPGVATCEIG